MTMLRERGGSLLTNYSRVHRPILGVDEQIPLDPGQNLVETVDTVRNVQRLVCGPAPSTLYGVR